MQTETAEKQYSAFAGNCLIMSGPIQPVARAVKETIDRNPTALILIFDDETSEVKELDLRGTVSDTIARLSQEPAQSAAVTTDTESKTGPGRPKLGVVSREVTLLPRHWEWLNQQSGGASVALRKLVDKARHENEHLDEARRKREIIYRFMSAMAGNEEGFEEASRALFAGNQSGFDERIASWPNDLKEHLAKISIGAFA